MTPEQKAAIAAKLGVDLATLDSDRLIELALLHRAAPRAQPDFPTRLQAEITRRFTADAIAQDDVTYSTLQHLADTLTGVIPLAQRLLHEMAASINRDIWFTDNAAAFKDVLNNADSAKWLAGQTDVLEKALNNRLALTMIAESETAATAILSQADAVTLWKNAPALWDIWPQHAAGMQVLAKSGELVDYLFSIPAAVAAVQKQPVAIRALASHAQGVRHMTTITFMKTIVAEEEARKGFIANNDIFQSVREDLYKAVSAAGSGWAKARTQQAAAASAVNALSAQFSSPAGLLFTRFSRYNPQIARPNGKTTLKHPGGSIAAAGQDNNVVNQNNLNVVDGISFNGATFLASDDSNYVYAELWTPTP
nr:MAG TPA: hypothetical protein [Caudoviricetes sp.]